VIGVVVSILTMASHLNTNYLNTNYLKTQTT